MNIYKNTIVLLILISSYYVLCFISQNFVTWNFEKLAHSKANSKADFDNSESTVCLKCYYIVAC
jgi:hypothetical protein